MVNCRSSALTPKGQSEHLLLSGHLIKMPCFPGIWQREFRCHSLSCLFMLFHRSLIRASLGFILVLIKPTRALFPDGKETYLQFSPGNPLSLRYFSFLNTSQGMKNSFCNLFGFCVWLPLTFFAIVASPVRKNRSGENRYGWIVSCTYKVTSRDNPRFGRWPVCMTLDC